MDKVLKSQSLEFTHMDFYQNYVISQVREGEILTAKHIEDLTAACLNFYGDKEFVYISQRQQIYNVDPTIYLKLGEVKSLRGIAICSEQLATLNMAQFEKTFSKIPFEIFVNLGEATTWAVGCIKK